MAVRRSLTHALYLLVGAVAGFCLVYDVVLLSKNRMYYTGITQVLFRDFAPRTVSLTRDQALGDDGSKYYAVYTGKNICTHVKEPSH